MMLRHLILSLVLLANTSFAQNPALNSPGFAFAQSAALNSSSFDSSYRLTFRNAVQDKNFYLLSLFQRHPDVRRLLSENKALKKLSEDKLQALRMAANCNDVACFDRLLRFSGLDIDAVANEFEGLAKHPSLKKLAIEMRRSGAFIKYNPQSDPEMLIAAWRDAANGMNRLLSVYGLGNDPTYKDIDKVSFDVSSEAYRTLLKTKTAEIKLSKDALFFEPTLDFALKLLEANRRDEAGRYEPLAAGENKAAVQNLKKIRWSDYPYSFILVLGSGPSDSARISKIGAQRADQGAQLFLEHKAPLIILSGGHAHPMQTPFSEAIEMKKYLMAKYKIAAQSILIDPYARHTTTNFRNAARLVFRYGIPADLKALVTSSEDHITYTTKEDFRTRCLKELGYFPLEWITRASPTSAEFKPSVASLFFEANDPLDP
ncbi:MAG TPA: YdcF family protein [Pyrinomonadaceae bacterium]|nr:YdcF family protein [Pyrinomonadaceae bacterium]